MDLEKLLIKLSNEMQLRGFTKQTKKSYIYNVSQFLKWIQKKDKKINSQNIKEYILEFSKNKDINTIKLRKASIKFFLINILNKENTIIEIPKMKKKEQLPKVISKDEIKELLNNIKNKKHNLMISLLYSSGLRVSELIFLKKENLNLNENLIYVKRGKGRKDRTTIISKQVKEKIINHITQNEFKTKYLFESNRNTHYTIKTVEEILKKASKTINKHVTPHMLRHSFATHLLDSGTDIRLIQKLLAHQNLETTSIYTYVSNRDIKNIKAPDEI